MTETQTRSNVDQVEEDNVVEIPTDKEPVEEKTPQEELDEQIAVFEPVSKAVDRKLNFNGDERTYVQHEMGFMTKLKFFKLLSGSIRQATDSEGIEFLNEFLSPGAVQNPDAMLNGILGLIEIVPEFIEDAYCYALSIPIEDQVWAKFAFENLGDDEGLDILDVFIAQNGKSIQNFLTQKLPKLGKRIQTLLENTDT